MPTYTAIVISAKRPEVAISHFSRILKTVLAASYPRCQIARTINITTSAEGNNAEIALFYPDNTESITQSLKHVAENAICELHLACRDLAIPSRIIRDPHYVLLPRKGYCGRLIRSELNQLQNVTNEPTWVELTVDTGCAVRMQIGTNQGREGAIREVACISICRKTEAPSGIAYRIATVRGNRTVLMPCNYTRVRLEPGMWITSSRIIGKVTSAIVEIQKCQGTLFDYLPLSK